MEGEHTEEERKVLSDLRRAVVTADPVLAKKAAETAMVLGLPPAEVIDRGLGAGMQQISDEFDAGRMFLPQILAATHAMGVALAVLLPVIKPGDGSFKGVIVIGSVHGDIHEIGKNVCAAMLRGAGYRVIDLGSDVSVERFLSAAEQEQADIIAASALMTTTLTVQRDLVREVRETGQSFRTAVGGAPCSQEWCDAIGASGYSASAGEIVQLAGRLIKQSRGHGA